MEDTPVLFATERKERIVSYVEEHGRVTVGELCELFDVSGATIRNDLRELEQRRLITRVHGGVMRRSRVSEETLIDSRISEPQPARQIIARLALEQVDDGDTIILDTGTTCHELARLLHSRCDLTVITNDLRSALTLEQAGHIRVIVIGGRLRNGYHCTIEPVTSPWEEISADKAFLGANGFTAEKGATTPDMGQAGAKLGMISAAAKIFLLADESKFGRNSAFRFARPEQIDLLITDRIDGRLAGQLEGLAVEYLVGNRNGGDS